MDDRLARAAQAVDERRLADVREADDRDGAEKRRTASGSSSSSRFVLVELLLEGTSVSVSSSAMDSISLRPRAAASAAAASPRASRPVSDTGSGPEVGRTPEAARGVRHLRTAHRKSRYTGLGRNVSDKRQGSVTGARRCCGARGGTACCGRPAACRSRSHSQRRRSSASISLGRLAVALGVARQVGEAHRLAVRDRDRLEVAEPPLVRPVDRGADDRHVLLERGHRRARLHRPERRPSAGACPRRRSRARFPRARPRASAARPRGRTLRGGRRTTRRGAGTRRRAVSRAPPPSRGSRRAAATTSRTPECRSRRGGCTR